MRIKRFEALSVQEALQMVKQDLGPEAVILYTKKLIKGGFFGFFGRQLVEVTAGVDLPVLEAGDSRPVAQVRAMAKKASKQSLLEDDNLERRQARPVLKRAPAERRLDLFQSELSEGKVLAGGAWPRPVASSPGRGWVAPVARFEKVLLKAGVEEELVRKVLDLASREIDNHGYPSEEGVERVVHRCLCGLVKVGGGIAATPGSSRVVAFIGPTGVGKTTTLVKLASQYSLIHKLKVGMITADTYRIGAVEQLKIYRDIIDIPLDAVNSPEELGEALKRQSDRDLIFFDTAGRSPQNRRQIQDLRGFFELAKPQETHLVVSATTKDGDLLPIVAKFGLVPIHRFLFTKLDETKSFGTLVNLCAHFGIPVSYFTTGQNVPNDIEVATPEKLADLVLGEGHGRPG